MHLPVLDCRQLAPLGNFIRPFRVGLRTGGRPREHYNFRTSGRYLGIRNFLAGRDNHLAAAKLHQFRHPGRGTDSGIRPRLAIDADGLLRSPRFLLDLGESATHLLHQPLGSNCPAGDAAKQASVHFNIGKSSRIHGKKSEGLRDEFCNRLRFVGHGADHQTRMQAHDLVHRIHVPAVAELRQMADRGNVRAPLRDADQETLCTDGTKNRSGAGGQRYDAQRSSAA